MNFLSDEELQELLAICEKYLRAVALRRRIDAKLGEIKYAGPRRKFFYWLANRVGNLYWRLHGDLDARLGASGWYKIMVESLPPSEHTHVVTALLLNQVAALRDEVRGERDRKYEALRKIGEYEQMVAYIDRHTPVAAADQDEPGITFTAAVRREMHDAGLLDKL